MKKNNTLRLLIFLGVLWCGFKVWENAGSDRYIFDINKIIWKSQAEPTADPEEVPQEKESKAASGKKEDVASIPQKKDDSEEKRIWGDNGGSDFIKELKSENPMEGLITDEDRDWIDVDGMKNITLGNAAAVKDSNRYWIGKEVTITVPDGDAFDRELKKKRIKYEEQRDEWADDNGYISDIDKAVEYSYFPYTVNLFATVEKEGEYITQEVIFGDKALIVYTKPDGSGWNLKKGESLEFEAEQYKLDKEKVPKKGQNILFGYIHDGKLYKSIEDSRLLHSYKLTAEADGEYFITIMGNLSMVTLKNGCIRMS